MCSLFTDIVRYPGLFGQAGGTLIGMDAAGKIAGHSQSTTEPILLGIREKLLVRQTVSGQVSPMRSSRSVPAAGATWYIWIGISALR